MVHRPPASHPFSLDRGEDSDCHPDVTFLRSAPKSGLSLSPTALLEASERELTAEATERLHSYLPIARLIGQRTAELHRILATATGYSYLAPEPFTQLYQRSMYQSARVLTCTVLEKLRDYLPRLPTELRADAERVTAGEAELLVRFGQVLKWKLILALLAIHTI
jgi:maltose alpha-D-glucosyltransferase/alpha-amylase